MPQSLSTGNVKFGNATLGSNNVYAFTSGATPTNSVQLTGNATLLRELKAINERLLVFRMIDFGRADRVASTCAQHLAILERIEAGDGEGARAALRANVEEGRKIVHATFKDALARAYATV